MRGRQAYRRPLLITAGAGSGKTKVLTCRIAHLLELGVAPYRILAITFTNKAAKEMKERVTNLVGAQADSIWLSTFHSFCAKLLRFEVDGFHGYTRNFTIYDSSDQLVLVKDCLKKLNLDDKQFTPRSVLGTISSAKNVLMDAKAFAAKASDFYEQKVADVYAMYQEKLRENNAVDFETSCSWPCASCRKTRKSGKNTSPGSNISWSTNIRIRTMPSMP